MSALFEAAGAGVYAVDEGGLVIACNPWAERLLGYEAGTLIGVDAHAILNPRAGNAAGVPEQRPVLREVALGKRVSGDRAVLLCADGSPLPVWWSAAPLPPEMGHGAGAVVVFHDISAQRKREGQRADRYAHSETMREQAEYDLSEVTWLSELTLAMVSTLEAEQSLERLARQLVPRLADTAVVHLCEGEVAAPCRLGAPPARCAARQSLRGTGAARGFRPPRRATAGDAGCRDAADRRSGCGRFGADRAAGRGGGRRCLGGAAQAACHDTRGAHCGQGGGQPAVQRGRPGTGRRSRPPHRPGAGQRPPARSPGRHRRHSPACPAHRPARGVRTGTGRPLPAGTAGCRSRRRLVRRLPFGRRGHRSGHRRRHRPRHPGRLPHE
ncbi:PAS domain-containing protein [Streptomyces collinus]